MSSSNIFSLVCGVLVGLFMVLLFNERLRQSVTQRSVWLTKHPNRYVLVLVLAAVSVLVAAYLITLRFP